MKPKVFIHTNHKQYMGALVSAHSMRRNSKTPDAFDVELIELKDHMDIFGKYEGRDYLRDGVNRTWLNDDLQSFTPLRFMPPELMGYQGKAVVVDPDVFAVQDVKELFDRDMQGKAVWCAYRAGHPASSVMLMDCAQLANWKVSEDFDALFRREREYKTWMNLGYQPAETIGQLEAEWNDFDKLSPQTKMIHNTRRKTQPWKSGLPVDFVPAENNPYSPLAWIMFARRKLFGPYGLLGTYKSHPDRNQENFFFGLLKECVDNGTITEPMLKDAMKHNFVRHDAFEVMERVPDLPRAA
ncbi:MAG: hypothetical protein H6851_12870 [Geminicoccaceae bacterium]|nr:hypothetical protein [Geminicoccaceae bacterium]MCB9944497.1 hypothetical protein [Geminicoccaceae bacterium]